MLPRDSSGARKAEGQSGVSPGAAGRWQLEHSGSLGFERGSWHSKVLLPALAEEPPASHHPSQPSVSRAETREAIKGPQSYEA